MKLFQTRYLFFWLIFSGILFAQNDYNLVMKMEITSPDTQSIVLHHTSKINEFIEGYYFTNNYLADLFMMGPNAAIKEGGFSLLEGKVFGGFADYMSQKWVNNKFEIEDLSVMTNGFDVDKALSFQIKPMTADINSNELHLFIKFAVYDFEKTSNYEFDLSTNIKLFYKQIIVKLDEPMNLEYFNQQFKGCNFSIVFSKENLNEDKTLLIERRRLYDTVIQSVKESNVKDENFIFNLGYECRKYPSLQAYYERLANHYNLYIHKYDHISHGENDDMGKLPINIYSGELNFPFLIYSPKKLKELENFKTRNKILQSKYKIIIVPISQTADSVTADLFIDYSKISLDDKISRWSPIKKRITIGRKSRINVELPAENWSADFIRKGEHYQLYGYSDFNRFVKESLIIELEN